MGDWWHLTRICISASLAVSRFHIISDEEVISRAHWMAHIYTWQQKEVRTHVRNYHKPTATGTADEEVNEMQITVQMFMTHFAMQ